MASAVQTRPGWPFKLKLRVLMALVFMAVFLYIYWWAPLPGIWNDVIVNGSYVLAAGWGAITTGRIWLQFKKDASLSLMWGAFSAALWIWTLAEVASFYSYTFVFEEQPGLGPADILWGIGYIAFAISFITQYRLLFSPTPGRIARWVAAIAAAVLLATLITTSLMRGPDFRTEQTWAETFVNVFYPYGDLAVALAALGLARLFKRGLWGRGWIGLLVFVVSDSLYSLVAFSGLYAVSVEMGNPFSLLVDALYLAAYLVVALICYTQLLLVRFGPSMQLVELPPEEEAFTL